MGHFRFRRSVGPKWLKLNVSKTGTSITAGAPGFHVNTPLSGRRRRSMMTIGLPGAGLSHPQEIGESRAGERLLSRRHQPSCGRRHGPMPSGWHG
jgi:hypothetical protein